MHINNNDNRETYTDTDDKFNQVNNLVWKHTLRLYYR